MVGEPHYANKSAIVLDDNPQMRGILRSILNTMGLRSVAEFSDPIGAHNHLEGHHVDVAVVDLVLNSSINGMELALAVRHNPLIVNPMMPIVMVTGYASASVITQAINFGVDELVTKPFSARDLMVRVEKTIKRPRSYIRTPSGYFGPDRRRRIDPMYRGPERRQDDLADILDSQGNTVRKAIKTLRPDPVVEKRSVEETVEEAVFMLD